jgi:large subunit ribosomal protein L15
MRIGFEGGQMPLLRRIPKRGFNHTRFATRYLPVNVCDLEQFDNGARVDEAALRAAGLANGPADGVKILGGGELTKKLMVSASAFSASARAKIEAKGGTCEIISRKAAAEPAKT